MADKNPPRAVMATDRFLDDVFGFRAQYADIYVKVASFVVNKQAWSPGETTASKDYRLKDPLDGVWHVHIVFGKAIVIYDVQPKRLTLYRMVPHDHVEDSSKQTALRKYIDGVTEADLATYLPVLEAGANPEFILSQADLVQVRAMLYEAACNETDRTFLLDATAGNPANLFSFLRVMCEFDGHGATEVGAAILKGFNGQAGFMAEISEVLANSP